MFKLKINRFEDVSAGGADFKFTAEMKNKGFDETAKKARQVNSAFNELSEKPLQMNVNSVNNAINKLENLQKTIDVLKKYDNIDINANIKDLKKNGAFNTLPSDSQNTLETVGNMQTGFVKDGNYEKLKSTLSDSLNILKDIKTETENAEQKMKDEEEASKSVEEKFKEMLEDLRKMPSLVEQVSSGFKSMNFTKLVSLYRTIRRVTSGLVNIVEDAANYEESLNLYTMALGEYVDEATKWSDEITEKLMLDPSQVMQYTGAFYNLTKGLGASADNAFLMSKNLTQLTYDMSSYLNISVSAAQAKIQSAMAGQSRAVASVGVATQQASLQELAYKLGIDKKVESMTQSEKTYLRYIQLLKNTKQMQGDLGRTMITPANAIRTLKTQITLLGRAIGQALTPFIMEVIPYIMAFTSVLTRAAQAVASFFGYKIADVDYGSAFNYEDIEDYADAINGIGSSISAAGKKAKNSLAPFDDLNQVMSTAASSGSGSGGVGSTISDDTWSKLLSGYDMLSDYTDTLKAKAEGLEGVVQAIVDMIGGIVVISAIGKIVDLFAKWQTRIEKIKDFWKFISSAKVVSVLKTTASIFGIVVGVIVTVASTVGTLKDAVYTQTKYQSDFNIQLLGTYTAIGLLQTALVVVLSALNPFIGIFAGVGIILADVRAISEGHKKALQELADSNIYGNLSVSVDQWTDAMERNSDIISYTDKFGDITTTLDDLYQDFTDAAEVVELYGYKFKAVGDQISLQDTQNMKNAIDDMCSATSQMIQETTEYSLGIWGSTFENMDTLTEDEEKSILNSITTYGANQQKELDDAQKNITDTYDKAIKDRGYLTDEEYQYIQTQLKKIRELTEKEMSSNQANLEYIKQVSADKNLRLDKESYSTFKEALQKYQEEKQKTIQDNYTALINDAQKYRDGSLKGEETYNAMMKTAYEQRVQDENDLAEEIKGYQNSIVDNLIKVYGEFDGQTDSEAEKTRETIEGIFKDLNIDDSQVKERFQTLSEDLGVNFSNKFTESTNLNMDPIKPTLDSNGIGKDFSGSITNYMKQHPLKLATSVTTKGNESTLNITARANGGYVSAGDLFFANENGRAEFITSIGGKTAVANQDQMVQAVSNAIIAGFNQFEGGKSSQPGITQVYIGNDKVYEGQGTYQNRQTDRYGTSYIRI